MLGVIPHDGRDLGLVPRRLRQHPLILAGLGHVPGLLQQRVHLWLVEWLLGRQDRQAVQGHTGQPGQLLALCIG